MIQPLCWQFLILKKPFVGKKGKKGKKGKRKRIKTNTDSDEPKKSGESDDSEDVSFMVKILGCFLELLFSQKVECK